MEPSQKVVRARLLEARAKVYHSKGEHKAAFELVEEAAALREEYWKSVLVVDKGTDTQ